MTSHLRQRLAAPGLIRAVNRDDLLRRPSAVLSMIASRQIPRSGIDPDDAVVYKRIKASTSCI
jgi:hypothetical protein